MGEPTLDHVDGRDSAAVEREPGSVSPDGTERRGTTASAAAAAAATSAGSGGRSTGALALARVRRHLRSPGHPRLWIELLLIGVSYWIYSMIRNAVPTQQVRAEHNAADIWHFEQSLGAATEQTVNHWFNSVEWLIVGMNYYYATLHFIMTIGVLVWLFRRHPGRYQAARLALFVTTGIALVGYYFYPLAPPRLLTGGHFIDTVEVHHTWGSMASGNMASVSNQFAAMPSMHIGWSLFCGVTIAVLARRRWAKVLGLAYPLATLEVIVGTANHFYMDALAGAACTGTGFLASRLVYGRWAYAFPRIRTHVVATPAPPARVAAQAR
jgi:hypothetical protein